jgi:uncharacterized membrane protein YkvA (DUF1232 family)
MTTSDIQAVVASAQARGTDSLERLIRNRNPDAPDPEVTDQLQRAVAIIVGLPDLLERAEQEARIQGVILAVAPVLARAREYVLRPVDLIPEMTRGLAGLLDDAYFVLRLLHALGQGPEPLLRESMGEHLGFLRGLTGEDVAGRLDRLSVQTLLETQKDLRDAWEEGAAEA